MTPDRKKKIHPNYAFLVKTPEVKQKTSCSKNYNDNDGQVETGEESNQKRGKHIVTSCHGSGPSKSYVHCSSLDSYHPYQAPLYNSKLVNQALNLHLGLPINPRNVAIIRKVCKILSYFLAFVEVLMFKGWDTIPMKLRQTLTAKAWKLYYPIHRALLSNRTAIHKNASYEYHALSTIMYWGRLFPVSVRRMRFSLSQLEVWHGDDAYPVLDQYHYGLGNSSPDASELAPNSCLKTSNVYHSGKLDEHGLLSKLQNLSSEAKEPVSGYYVTNGKQKSSNKVLFYLYGGAFIGGDSEGNVRFASKLCQVCGIDAFVPSYRLAPEYGFSDALDDIIRAYIYLIGVKGVKPQDVVLFGISSGGGLVIRLMQRIREILKEASSAEVAAATDNVTMPGGAVLMCPFVDFTVPEGSLTDYSAHDLIVNEVSLKNDKNAFCLFFVINSAAQSIPKTSSIYLLID